MDFTQDVILDLLPLYLAGEASPATRELVEGYLKDHPDLAERVRKASEQAFRSLPPAKLPPDLEMRSLRRTMHLLTWRNWLFTIAMWLTGISLMTVISFDHGVHIRFFFQDYPRQLTVCGALAVQAWIYYWIVRYRLRTRR